MKYLPIRGEKRKIPGFPHHKNFVYKSSRIFEAKTIFDYFTIDGYFQEFKKLYYNRKYRCVIPRLLLIDPTSACNLKCKGCWAADYQKNSHLTYEKLDELCTEAQKIGVLTIIMSGGEPLLRKNDILRLCEKHKKLTFGLYTNGILIDEAFVKELVRIENLNVFVSIEGYREDTDSRRGEGTYDKVIAAMDLLKKYDIGFGFSICYHSKNYKTVSGDEFLNFLQEKGAWFGWMFNYLPIGNDADISLCCNAEQRAYVKQKIEEYYKNYKFTIIDFANSGHKAFGCVAAGSDFAHINANGDLEPCAFCHYSDVNINNMSLIEALKSPFFKNFRQHKPFSGNYLRPCPIMDVPEALAKVTDSEGVHSTHYNNSESVQELADKIKPLALKWEIAADKMYADMPEDEKKQFGILSKIVHWRNNIILKW
jgi:MoaA/NifB/PqqE/SkfB family radical SAM enzyme